jgi:glycerol uptake facilitator protein
MFLAPSAFLGELVGTLVLILLGNGVVANVVLDKTKGQNSGWIVITSGWAFAVMVGVFIAQRFGSLDAHLNPAVTLAFAIQSGDFTKLLTYIPAQILGATIGATLVWLTYLPHWEATEDKALKLAAFCTSPAIRDTKSNFIAEVIGTIVLILGVASIASGTTAGFLPYLVGILVWSIGLSLGGTTGYAINPARDLGPRIAHHFLPIAGKGDSDWQYAWLPVAAPLAGAAIGGMILAMFAF